MFVFSKQAFLLNDPSQVELVDDMITHFLLVESYPQASLSATEAQTLPLLTFIKFAQTYGVVGVRDKRMQVLSDVN